MAVYVDPIVYRYGGEQWCHLWADSGAQLAKAGAELKLDPALQFTPPFCFGHPVGYYMVNEAQRKAAIKAGAKETDKHQMALECAEATWNQAEIDRIENLRAWG